MRSSTWWRAMCPNEEQRFNMKFAVRKEDKSLLEFVNDGINELLTNGKMKQIVESYGVPFYRAVFFVNSISRRMTENVAVCL